MNNELNETAISLFRSDILDKFINLKFKKGLINKALNKTLEDRHWIFLVIYSWINKKTNRII